MEPEETTLLTPVTKLFKYLSQEKETCTLFLQLGAEIHPKLFPYEQKIKLTIFDYYTGSFCHQSNIKTFLKSFKNIVWKLYVNTIN